MEKEIIINSREEMINLGEKIGRLLKANMVLALEGDLGAGKTTLTKGIALGLNIKDVVNSPTFTIMKIYEGSLMLYHLDVYRVDERDFELSEYFEDDGVCVIEWAKNIDKILPNERLDIIINDLGDNKRKVKMITNDSLYIKLIGEINL